MRDVLRDTEESARLEASNRAAMTRDQLEDKLTGLKKRHADDKNNLALVKEIATVHEQLEDWANAYAFYTLAYDLSSRDVALQTKAAFMKNKKAELELTELRECCEADPDNVELRNTYNTMLTERTALQVSEAQERVDWPDCGFGRA